MFSKWKVLIEREILRQINLLYLPEENLRISLEVTIVPE